MCLHGCWMALAIQATPSYRRNHLDRSRDAADHHDPTSNTLATHPRAAPDGCEGATRIGCGTRARSTPNVSACDDLGTDRYTCEVLFRS